jgi:GNAT superfamily N-acetyltransferase
MSDVIIREAKEGDYKELMKLYNDFVDENRYSEGKEDSFEEVLVSTENFIYVAEDDGKLVGFVTFSIRWVVRYPRPIAEMDELFVLPKYRRKGLGSKLMEIILEKAAELGCYRMFIESHYKYEPAQKLYEKMEFTNYGHHFVKDL